MNSRNAIVLASLASLLVSGCASKPVEKVEAVATINGEAVSTKEYVTLLERKSTVQVATQQGVQEARVAGSLGIQALRDLVERRLVLQMATEDKVVPTDDDVKAELDYQIKERPTYLTELAEQGISKEMAAENLKVSLARERLITKGITIPMSEVDAFIAKNPKQFEEPERVQMLFIAITDATKRGMVDKDLSAGQDFLTVATRYSEDPNVRQNGAKFSQEALSTFPPALQTLVNATPELKATKWYQEGSAWFKFYVTKKIPAKKVNMDEGRKRHLQRQMMMEKGQASSDFPKRLADKIRTAQVDVQSDFLRDPWNKAFEQAKTQMAKQQAAQAAGAGAAPDGAPSGGPAAGSAPARKLPAMRTPAGG